MMDYLNLLPTSKITKKVQEDLFLYGWTILATPYRDILFLHTFGLQYNYGHPEFEMLGAPEELAVQILNFLSHRVRQGESFPIGTTLSGLIDNYDLKLVMNPFDPLGDSITNGRLRVIWPDANHHYPWDEGCSLDCLRQQLCPDSTLPDRKLYETIALLNQLGTPPDLG